MNRHTLTLAKRLEAEFNTELLRTMPFLRFELHLANGNVVRVNHPDFASLQPSGRILIVWREADEGFDIIDLLLVNNVTVAPPPPAAA